MRIIITLHLEARTCEPFKHVLWAPNTQVVLGNTLHTNKHNFSILHTISFDE